MSPNVSYLKYQLSFAGLSQTEILKLKEAQELAKKQRQNLPCILQAIFPMDPEKTTPKLIGKLKTIILTDDKLSLDGKLDDNLTECLSENTSDTLSKIEDKVLQIFSPDSENLQLSEYNYSDLLKKLNIMNSKNEQLPPDEKATIIKTLKDTNQDGWILSNKILPSIDNLKKLTKENKHKLVEAVQKPLDDNDIDRYFDENLKDIITSTIVIGDEALKSRMEQRIYKFDRTLKTIANLNKDIDLINGICNISKFAKSRGDNIKIVELVDGLLSAGYSKKDLISDLKQMSEKKTQDIDSLSIKYVEQLLSFNKKDISKIRQQSFDNWNLDYVYTIPSALETLEKRDMPKHKKYLIDLMHSDLEGNYASYINDLNTNIGISNMETKKLFEKNNLDFQEWLNYSKSHQFTLFPKADYDAIDRPIPCSTTHRFPKQKQELEIKLWERKPGKNLFQGSYSGVCLSLDGINCFAGIDSLLYDMGQIAELKKNGKTVGSAYMYWGKRTNENTLSFLIDVIDLSYDYKNNPQIRTEFTQFAKNYANAVAHKDVPIYIGSKFSHVPTDDLEKIEKEPFKLIGTTNNEKFYLDSIDTDIIEKRHVKVSPNESFFTELKLLK